MEEKIIRVEHGTDHEGFHDYMYKITNLTRERMVTSFLPRIIEGKLIWLKKVIAIERKHYTYRKELDEWTYSFYWEYRGEYWHTEKYRLIEG